MVQKYGAIALLAVSCLAGGWLLLPQRQAAQNFDITEDNIVLHPPKEQNEEAEVEALPEGRALFVDPEGRFSFEYDSNGGEYMVEQLYKSDDIFAVCDALGCNFVGVEVGPLKMAKDGRPAYRYRRLTYDRDIPDSFESITWNGYPAFRAEFAWQEYPERELFIHIPHGDQLFTIYRSVKDDGLVFRQFDAISSTFNLLK